MKKIYLIYKTSLMQKKVKVENTSFLKNQI